MALSTLRVALRPSLIGALRPSMLGAQSAYFVQRSAPMTSMVKEKADPMASTAQDQMKAYWKKNLDLQRPNSPWMIYRWELPMLSSLTHRVTGIAMTVALYTFSVTLLVLPDTVPHYIELLKGLELGPAVWFPLKTIAAFPLTYHSLNALRHLGWDFYGGYEVNTQMRTAYICYGTAALLAVGLAGFSYFI